MSSAVASASRTIPGTCVAECKCERAPTGVVFGETGAWFDRHRRFTAHAEVSLDPHWRLRERGIDVATLELAVDNHVAAGLLVQPRRGVFNGFQRIDDDRQRFEFDVDHFERVFGKVAALRHDADQRFADVVTLSRASGRIGVA